MLCSASIRFVNIGIEFDNVGKSLNLFGLQITYYGIIVAAAILAGMLLAFYEAKRTGQNVDTYMDFAIIVIVLCIIGARLYYVVFNWEVYKNDPLLIFNLREGGLAIYGAIIAAYLTCYVFTRIKKLSFYQMADTGSMGLLIGQIIGRWGNFFNREAFGGYTDNLFAMQIKLDEAGGVVTEQLIANKKVVDGVTYIQVHPTFLYESLWNSVLLILIFIFRDKKKFQGEVFLWYIGGYAVGRSIIEGFRTDQLMLPFVQLPVSQVLSVIFAAAAFIMWVFMRRKESIR